LGICDIWLFATQDYDHYLPNALDINRALLGSIPVQHIGLTKSSSSTAATAFNPDDIVLKQTTRRNTEHDEFRIVMT